MKPTVVIVEGATGVTGGFMAAKREAESLRGLADVILVIPTDEKFRPADLDAFSEVVRLPLRPLQKSPGSILAYLPSLFSAGFRLARLLKERRCARLQINDYYLMHGRIARLFGYRGILATWVRMDPANHGPVGRFWLRMARLASDEMVTVSKHLRDRLPRAYSPRLIYDPVVADAPLRSSSASSTRFVFFGNFMDGKGQEMAIEAFDSLAEDFLEAELAFYGGHLGLAKNRAYLERLKAMAADSRGVGRISFNGFVADPAPVLRSALAALNLSKAESFSLTCQEASAAGLPVIATRSGGPAEIIQDGVTGFLVPVGDAEAVAERMRTLLREPQQAQEMGERGAQLVRERFPVDTFRRELRALFDL